MRMKKAITVVVILSPVIAIIIFFAVFGGSWRRGGVKILDANVVGSDIIELTASSCNQGAAMSELRETDEEVRIKVTHDLTLFSWMAGEDCATLVLCLLERPLDSRRLIDLHTGDTVEASLSEYQHPQLPQLRDTLTPSVPCTPPYWFSWSPQSFHQLVATETAMASSN